MRGQRRVAQGNAHAVLSNWGAMLGLELVLVAGMQRQRLQISMLGGKVFDLLDALGRRGGDGRLGGDGPRGV